MTIAPTSVLTSPAEPNELLQVDAALLTALIHATHVPWNITL
jgi:hypothetical protein